MRARKAQGKKLERARNRAQALSDKPATEGRRRRRNRAQAESEKQEWLRKRAGRALHLLRRAVRNANEPGFQQRAAVTTTCSVATTHLVQNSTAHTSEFKIWEILHRSISNGKALNPFCPIRRHCVELARHKADARDEKSG
jgi:hypothetical protein